MSQEQKLKDYIYLDETNNTKYHELAGFRSLGSQRDIVHLRKSNLATKNISNLIVGRTEI